RRRFHRFCRPGRANHARGACKFVNGATIPRRETVSCLLVLLALAAPRLAVILVWLFSDVFSQAFDSALWPILGFIFLPTTLLCYTAVDRKSTRLNSSHVKISYAVFCLKK